MTAAQTKRAADAVAEGLAGQQDAAQFVAPIRGNCGDGDELFHAMRILSNQAETYQRGWCRRIQKTVES